jgi:hypothetical protein
VVFVVIAIAFNARIVALSIAVSCFDDALSSGVDQVAIICDVRTMLIQRAASNEIICMSRVQFVLTKSFVHAIIQPWCNQRFPLVTY